MSIISAKLMYHPMQAIYTRHTAVAAKQMMSVEKAEAIK